MSALAGPQMSSLKKSSCRMAPVQGVKSDGTSLGVGCSTGWHGDAVVWQMSALAGPQMSSLKKSSCRMAPVQGVKSDGTSLGDALLAGMGMLWFDLCLHQLSSATESQ